MIRYTHKCDWEHNQHVTCKLSESWLTMKTIHSLDPHACWIGIVLANVYSIEWVLRAIIRQVENAHPGLPLSQIRVGDVLEVNGFSKFDQLDDLVKKYNQMVPEAYQVDPYIVEIRGYLSDGRVAGDEDDAICLIRLSQPVNGRAKVTHKVFVSLEWYKRTRIFITKELRKACLGGVYLGAIKLENDLERV